LAFGAGGTFVPIKDEFFEFVATITAFVFKYGHDMLRNGIFAEFARQRDSIAEKGWAGNVQRGR